MRAVPALLVVLLVLFVWAQREIPSRGPSPTETLTLYSVQDFSDWLDIYRQSPRAAFQPTVLEQYWHGHGGLHPAPVKIGFSLASRWWAGNGASLRVSRWMAFLCLFGIGGLMFWSSRRFGRSAFEALWLASGATALLALVGEFQQATVYGPVVLLWLATVFLLVHSDERENALSWGMAGVAAVLWGLAWGTKFTALLILPILLAWTFSTARHERTSWTERWGRKFVLLAVVAPVVLFLSWPWLWDAPLRKVILHSAMHAGNVLPEDPLYRWVYPLILLLFATPLPTLPLLVLGGWKLRQRRDVQLHLWNILFGLSMYWLPLPSREAGWRHALPALASIGWLSTLGALWLAEWGTAHGKRWLAVVPWVWLAFILFHLLWPDPLRPYYLNVIGRWLKLQFWW